MKHKVSELEGALLDAAVAKAEGIAWRIDPEKDWCVTPHEARALNRRAGDFNTLWQPSSEWSQAGPIIDREQISLKSPDELGDRDGKEWEADMSVRHEDGAECFSGSGPTPLIAAMRAYLASKFGEEVELP